MHTCVCVCVCMHLGSNLVVKDRRLAFYSAYLLANEILHLWSKEV